jgi:hypothetical protein
MFEDRMTSRQNTSLADAVLASRISASLGGNARDVQIRHARNVHSRDFQTNDFVMLGTVRANPWLSLFEQRLNFHFGAADADSPTVIRNRVPRGGERIEYAPANANDNAGSSYALVAVVSNLANRGRVLMIGGTAMAAMEEAGEYMLDPASLDDMTRLLGDPVGLESFELLFEVSAFEGTAKGAKLVAHRVKRTDRTGSNPP